MRFCDNCGRSMVRDTATGALVFRCPCGAAVKGGGYDARVGGAVIGASETTEMYRHLIQTAPHDRTVQLIRRAECPDCGLDYRVQIRVGDAEVIILKCKCGREEAGGVEGGASEHKSG